MEGIYVRVSYENGSSVFCDANSAIIFFVYQYLDTKGASRPRLNIVTDILESGDVVKVDVSGFEYSLITLDDLDENVKRCHLPAFYRPEECYIVAGLCGVLRQMVKTSNDRWLLGFREGGLSACAESSLWTKFCEVDLIAAVKEYARSPPSELPVDIIRFEWHLAQPVRTHNVRKASAKFPSTNGLPAHCYAEGPEMFLSDLIILPSVHFFFIVYGLEKVAHLVPLTSNWYELMLADSRAFDCLKLLEVDSAARVEGEISVPEVKKNSLYKSDRTRCKAIDKLFTKQEDVEYVTSVVDDIGILRDYDYKADINSEVDWNEVPFYAQPKGGDLPEERNTRKMQQIENIACAVLKIAEDGNTIVDFCCGTGHIGILVAYLLPLCRVLLIDNKEHSLIRAVERMQKLSLQNVFIIQSNVDYFKGSFQIGVALHACGVASDLVIRTCVSNRSKFIISPCCYGKLQANHILQYPRSKRLTASALTVRDYMVLGHSADQTHKELYAKSDQGEKCMKIIDVDRCIQAEECGYRVYLAKMKPTNCTPKNNVIVGVPEEAFKECYFE